MGVVVKAACGACKARWQCETGCGIMHGEIRNIIPLFPRGTAQEIEADIGKTAFPAFEFAYRLSCCEHCGSIESVPVLKLLDAHKEYVGVCGKCWQNTKLIENIEDTPCPVCHKKALSVEEAGMWD